MSTDVHKKSKPSIAELERQLFEKLKEDGVLESFRERQQRLAPHMPPIRHIRRSSRRRWFVET